MEECTRCNGHCSRQSILNHETYIAQIYNTYTRFFFLVLPSHKTHSISISKGMDFFFICSYDFSTSVHQKHGRFDLNCYFSVRFLIFWNSSIQKFNFGFFSSNFFFHLLACIKNNFSPLILTRNKGENFKVIRSFKCTTLFY